MTQYGCSQGRAPYLTKYKTAAFSTAISVATRVVPLAQHTPAGRWATTTSRSPGLRLEVPASPSRIADPVVFDAGRTAYSCGGSPGFEPEFPLIPVRGTCCVSVRCNNTRCRSTTECIHALASSRSQRIGLRRCPVGHGLTGLSGKLVSPCAAMTEKAEHAGLKSDRICEPREFPPCPPLAPTRRPLDCHLRNPRDRTADRLCLLSYLFGQVL
jgi:hypothetical protein